MSDFESRFGGIARLYGREALAKLRASRVLVVGLGGVGTWAAEALARSGVSHLRLVDLDEICISNVNRQLPALEGTVGLSKVAVMAERLGLINPHGSFEGIQEFFTEESAAQLLGVREESGKWVPDSEGTTPDCVIDAIDSVANKCRLIAWCRRVGIPCVSAGGAGGRRDPTRIRVADLQAVTHDPLLSDVRKHLRQHHGFPRSPEPMGVSCIFSTESRVHPQPDGTVDGTPAAAASDEPSRRLNCNWGYGSATPVTGTFGFVAAARAVEILLGLPPATSS
jgi:tRNA A37 threonylcarbamoyladenosine dehydratase